MSKLWFNELLETNTTPTIWISNAVEGVDQSFLRRFAYTIEVPALGARQRARTLRRQLGTPSPLSDGIAHRFYASPGLLGSASKTCWIPVSVRTS